jgi:transcriptional regulator GlxA family with amidase domain
MGAPRCASSAILARLGEILVVESVRTYVGSLQPGQGGWFGGLQDPRIAAVMRAIHEDPARPWTISALARKAAMSRTALAMRFRALIGTSVKAYVTHVRMTTAASLLEEPERPNLARVAEAVGYGSEAAFSRAFVREMGVAPTHLRMRAGGPLSQPVDKVERRPKSGNK